MTDHDTPASEPTPSEDMTLADLIGTYRWGGSITNVPPDGFCDALATHLQPHVDARVAEALKQQYDGKLTEMEAKQDAIFEQMRQDQHTEAVREERERLLREFAKWPALQFVLDLPNGTSFDDVVTEYLDIRAREEIEAE